MSFLCTKRFLECYHFLVYFCCTWPYWISSIPNKLQFIGSVYKFNTSKFNACSITQTSSIQGRARHTRKAVYTFTKKQHIKNTAVRKRTHETMHLAFRPHPPLTPSNLHAPSHTFKTLWPLARGWFRAHDYQLSFITLPQCQGVTGLVVTTISVWPPVHLDMIMSLSPWLAKSGEMLAKMAGGQLLFCT